MPPVYTLAGSHISTPLQVPPEEEPDVLLDELELLELDVELEELDEELDEELEDELEELLEDELSQSSQPLANTRFMVFAKRGSTPPLHTGSLPCIVVPPKHSKSPITVHTIPPPN